MIGRMGLMGPMEPMTARAAARGEGIGGSGGGGKMRVLSGFCGLTAGGDFHDFQAVARGQAAEAEFGWGDGLAVVLDDDAAGKELLGQKETLNGARQSGRELLPVGDDKKVVHSENRRRHQAVSAASQSFQTGS